MKISEVMKSPFHIDKDEKLSHAVELFEKHNIARLLVLEEGKLVGIITQRDVMEKIGYFKEDVKMSTYHVSTCMTKEPFTLIPSDPVEKAVELFCSRGISGIPIVEGADGELVGIVTKMDVMGVYTYSGKVSQWYTPNFTSISKEERVVHARMLMLKNNVRCFPVVNNELDGVITTSDVVFGLYKFMDLVDRHQSSLVRNLPVLDVMNRNPETALLSRGMENVKNLMIEKNISTIIVVDDEGKVIGLVSKDQFMEALWK